MHTHTHKAGLTTRNFLYVIFFSHMCICVQRVRAYVRVIVISSSHGVLRNFVGHGYHRSMWRKNSSRDPNKGRFTFT